MKLGNGGWGYRDMIIYTCIILFALFFVSISISSFYDGLKNSDNPNYNDSTIVDNGSSEDTENNNTNPLVVDYEYYKEQENALKSATINYVTQYSYDLTDDILTISLDTLIGFNFIDPIYDQTGENKCTGFSNVFINDDEYEVKPHITCSNYVTNGY